MEPGQRTDRSRQDERDRRVDEAKQALDASEQRLVALREEMRRLNEMDEVEYAALGARLEKFSADLESLSTSQDIAFREIREEMERERLETDREVASAQADLDASMRQLAAAQVKLERARRAAEASRKIADDAKVAVTRLRRVAQWLSAASMVMALVAALLVDNWILSAILTAIAALTGLDLWRERSDSANDTGDNAKHGARSAGVP